tara:strand:+ start:300 stop:482 length:183 start_codon:yes stop_codon:yes gene_type:complete
MSKKLKITQIKSQIGYREKTKKILKSLGLRGMNRSVIHSNDPAILGMIKKINHLLDVEEI